MQVQVRFFALAREKAGTSAADWALPDGATLADLWQALEAAHPALAPLASSVSFAVNREYAERSQPLGDGDEIAVIPPVSGG